MCGLPPTHESNSVTAPTSELQRLKNLGPVSARWLNAIGVYTEADLRTLGAVEAYGQITALFPGTSLNLL